MAHRERDLGVIRCHRVYSHDEPRGRPGFESTALASDGSGGFGIQPGSFINAIVGSTVTFSDGAPPWSTAQSADANASAATLFASDPVAVGFLTVTVTQTNGVTTTDANFDGTTKSGNIGSALAISNNASQESGGVDIVFWGVGTFEVTVKYTSTDTNYSTTTATSRVAVVVS